MSVKWACTRRAVNVEAARVNQQSESRATGACVYSGQELLLLVPICSGAAILQRHALEDRVWEYVFLHRPAASFTPNKPLLKRWL